jgi:zinc transport system substrate-binding protein
VETIIAGSAARRGVLDPLGADLPAGPDAYFQLLQGLADALRGCLSGG